VRLLDDVLDAGVHHISWAGEDSDGKAVASGLYFYRLQAGLYRKTRKMMLLK
jgi:flagellar hook assembly protein FlgD